MSEGPCCRGKKKKKIRRRRRKRLYRKKVGKKAGEKGAMVASNTMYKERQPGKQVARSLKKGRRRQLIDKRRDVSGSGNPVLCHNGSSARNVCSRVVGQVRSVFLFCSRVGLGWLRRRRVFSAAGERLQPEGREGRVSCREEMDKEKKNPPNEELRDEKAFPEGKLRVAPCALGFLSTGAAPSKWEEGVQKYKV
ncbi:hypothetical protein SODALDRAFT_91384 [Sodiomyces alkalinus F11]|uniref:Uncharacterized protein n=1 Tax=Sodiomyces alkalinus (strain CBS 110278 / VKM F-3762 / F11) TaxID=1314773 RepID=A0A3N2Q0L2_SODAK|nr:hypothetical protein SODALDRAFT_91384 [Sodiomyces alkalinus F11]ROT40228.1 hypothetical protein SODALDRAFT_91384 [Sodiomyces alkalinus F11]